MLLNQNAFDNDSCPVREELLGEMYRASEHGLPVLVETVSPQARAMLALFCYRRSHMHALALTIAASCSERDLIRIGGRVGSALYAQAQEAPAARQHIPSYGHRKPITLSTTPLSALPPLMDDLDDDGFDGDTAEASAVLA